VSRALDARAPAPSDRESAPRRTQRLGFAFNPTQEPAQELRDRALGWCAVRGVEAWSIPAGEAWLHPDEVAATDVIVVLGGDGTFLRAARAVAETDVPIIGINSGHIGFLSKAEHGRLEAILALVAAGEYQIEERMMLEARVVRRDGQGPPAIHVALNEAAIVRGGVARVVRLEVLVDESLLATYVCDGLVVASPTGSTGYSFSAGGPIVDPTSRNLVVTPIAAYLTPLRSSVVSPRHTVRVRVEEAVDCLVSIDGREDIRLDVGDAVVVSAREQPIRFLQPRGSLPFWDLLREKAELLPR
jgi:NAD+ kinase